jgi:hypothetical protein
MAVIIRAIIINFVDLFIRLPFVNSNIVVTITNTIDPKRMRESDWSVAYIPIPLLIVIFLSHEMSSPTTLYQEWIVDKQ